MWKLKYRVSPRVSTEIELDFKIVSNLILKKARAHIAIPSNLGFATSVRILFAKWVELARICRYLWDGNKRGMQRKMLKSP